MLSAIYPEFDWIPGKFAHVPRTYWKDTDNQKIVMDRIAKELNIKEMNDWYKISHKVYLII